MSVFKDFIIENNVTFRQCGPVSCMSLILKLGNPNDFMDINYKCLLKELKVAVTTKAVEKKPIEKSVGSNKGGISGDFLARLERKWCGYGYHEADEDNDGDAFVEDSDSGSDAEGANHNNRDASIVANDAANNNPLKKKKRNRDDVYDHEDWFVDDSEDAVVLRVEAKRYETKHSGFFVSEGSLDVNTTRSIALTKPLKKPSAPEAKDSSATNNKVPSYKAKTPQSASGGGAVLSQSTTPLNKLISTFSSTSPTRILSNAYSDKQEASGADEKQKRTRTVIPKPEYVAADSVKGGIDVVKEEIKRLKSMNDNRKFQFIPEALDAYLLLLDDLVRQHNPEIYNNTHVGYFEEISQAILDTQKPKVMKSYLTCIRARRDANHHLQQYLRLTDELVHEAKNSIVPFVALSNMDVANDVPELTATDSQSQQDASTDGMKKPKVDYKWTCSWKPAMRSLLSAIDKHLQMYAHHSNICRSNMSNHEKEKLQPDEVAVVDSKVHVTTHLKAIVSRGFPDACKNGDMTYLRTIISQEKNKESKKSGNKLPSHSPTKVSVAANNAVAAVKRKSEEVKSNEPQKKSMKVDDKPTVTAAAIVYEPLKGTSFRQIEFNIEDFTCDN